MNKFFRASRLVIRRKKWVVLLALAVLVAGAGLAWSFWPRSGQGAKDAIQQNTDPHYIRAQELLKQKLPSDFEDRLEYYNKLAINLEASGQYAQAAVVYEAAQKAVDAAKKGSDYHYYASIAQSYAAAGDKAKARQYYRKEIDYLRANAGEDLRDAAIESVQKAMEKL